MDYNQNNGQNKSPEFFTVGAGTNNPETNNFEAENNLDLSNTQVEWQKTPNNMNSVGNKALSATQEQSTISGDLETPKIGQIVELEPPKNPDLTQIPTTSITKEAYRKEVIKTEDTLSKEGIQEIDNAVDKFNKDGNAADFYETTREMMEVNLDNSYNRKLAT